MEYTEKTIEIINAARKLFSEKGFKAVTTKEIAISAGVNEVTIFRQFGNKDALFDEVMEYITSIPDINRHLNLAETVLENFLIDLGNLIQKVFLQNIDVFKIELFERNKPNKTKYMVKFPNQLKVIVTDYLITNFKMGSKEAETFAISYMTAIHGICIHKYLFQTFNTDVGFQQSLNLIIKGFK